MNTAARCFVLLACVGLCAAAVVRTDCQCVNFSKNVDIKRIADVQVLKPRPYCSRKEIIVILKDATKSCLDSNTHFARKVELTKLHMQRQAARRSVMNSATTASTNITMTTVATPTTVI